MSNPKTVELEVVSAKGNSLSVFSLNDRRDRIVAYHEGYITSFSQQMGYAFLCGLELALVRESLKGQQHGLWMKWREENIPHISKGSVDNYIQFSERLQAKFPTIGNLSSDRLLTNGQITDAGKKEILQAVKEVADGKSLMDMYRELDIVKKPKSRDEIDTSKKKQLTAEEKAAAEEAQAKALKDEKLAADAALCDHDPASRLSAADHKEIIESSIRIANFYRSLLKSKKTTGQIKKGKRK
jgi:hypothetical protein